MEIKKGMYLLNESTDMNDYYERPLRDIYIITDEEDLLLGLQDWLEQYSYKLLPDHPMTIKSSGENDYQIDVDVLSDSELMNYVCYLISIPDAKSALSDRA